MKENNELENDDAEWKSCCFKLDKDFMKFFVQVAISFMILTLSIYKLMVITDNSEDKSLYVSLLTLILGIYTNVPSVKVKKAPIRGIESYE